MKSGRGRTFIILSVRMTDSPTPPLPDLVEPVSSNDHLLGPADAPITLVEYGDYECPDCMASFPDVEALLGGNEQIRFVFRHFPRTSIHPRASVAAQAAEAAGAQGKFWDMHRHLFLRGGGLEPDDLDRLALRLNLEIYRFQADLTSRRWARRIERDAESGRRSGVTATPTFFVNGRRAGTTAPEVLKAIEAAMDRRSR